MANKTNSYMHGLDQHTFQHLKKRRIIIGKNHTVIRQGTENARKKTEKHINRHFWKYITMFEIFHTG